MDWTYHTCTECGSEIEWPAGRDAMPWPGGNLGCPNQYEEDAPSRAINKGKQWHN